MQLETFVRMAVLPLAISACNRGDDQPLTTAENEVGQVDAGGAGGTAASAQDFAHKAASSDRFEVESSRLAAGSAASADVKSFAQMMIDAHTASTAKLKAALAGQTIVPDDTLNGEQQGALSDLNGKKGAAFDTAYVAAQVSGHEKTLAALKEYAASGDNPALKQFASELVPTVTQHLESARKLQSKE